MCSISGTKHIFKHDPHTKTSKKIHTSTHKCLKPILQSITKTTEFNLPSFRDLFDPNGPRLSTYARFTISDQLRKKAINIKYIAAKKKNTHVSKREILKIKREFKHTQTLF